MIEIIGTAINQWDTGRSVTVTDIEASHVHFANQGDSKAPIMELVDSQASIPDYLLQTGKQLCVYAVLNGVTVESRVFPVKKRERPENYVYDDDQRNYIYELIRSAEEATAEANRVAEELQTARDSGEFTGPKGDPGPKGEPGTALIDDSKVGDAAWSSKNTVDKLCPAFTESGSIVTCEPVEGYPLTVTVDAEATTINRCGKNLIEYPYPNTTKTVSGITFTDNGDGTITANGTATGEAAFILRNTSSKPGSIPFPATGCCFGGCPSGGSTSTYYLANDWTGKNDTGGCSVLYASNAISTHKNYWSSHFKIVIKKGYTAENLVFKPYLKVGTATMDYEPYNGETFTPGDTIPALPGVNTIWADTGEVTVTGRADPTAIINKLTNAIVALGGNV